MVLQDNRDVPIVVRVPILMPLPTTTTTLLSPFEYSVLRTNNRTRTMRNPGTESIWYDMVQCCAPHTHTHDIKRHSSTCHTRTHMTLHTMCSTTPSRLLSGYIMHVSIIHRHVSIIHTSCTQMLLTENTRGRSSHANDMWLCPRT